MPEPIARKVLDCRKAFTWQGPFENWSRGWVRKHYWRVRTLFGSEEDALQECGVIFARCLNYYADTVNNPAWMMSLYKMSVANDWHTFADKDRRLRHTRSPEQLAANMPSAATSDTNLGPLAVHLRSASAELQHALSVIADAPAEILEMMFAGRAVEMTNRRIRRLCGLTGSGDLVGELRRLLS